MAHKLVSCKKPSNPNSDGDTVSLKHIFATKPKTNNDGEWVIGASWYVKEDGGMMYHEPIETLLGLGFYNLFYYLNDIHGQNPAFSRWWVSVCTEPDDQINMNEIIFIQDLDIYICVLDIINPNKCWIYPGYEKCAIGSGKAVNMSKPALSYINDKIIFVSNDQTIVHFDNLNAARCDYIIRSARNNFRTILESGIRDKIRIGQKADYSKYRTTLGNHAFIWDVYLRDLLKQNNIRYTDNSNYIKFRLTYDEGKDVFDYDNEMDKQCKKYDYYMEQLDFMISKKISKVRIKGVILKKKKKAELNGKHIINGLELLDTKESDDNDIEMR